MQDKRDKEDAMDDMKKHDMVQKVRNYIRLQHMIEKGDHIIVGVSGGADSVALLLVLHELKEEYKLELSVVHINHGIREDASGDAGYVKALCDAMSIPFYLFESDIPDLAKKQGMTEEEMGRMYRYQCFFEVMEQVGADKLAVAHHMDDQAETLLFHLVRGSRLSGMVGMQPVTDAWNGKAGKIIRPLLGCKKEELTDWLKQHNISWKEDCTNQDNNYSRNCIRNQIIPLLEQINSRAVAHMTEYAEEMAEYREFFQAVVSEYVEREVIKNTVGSCETNREYLLQQKPVLARAVIYEMICTVSGNKKDIGGIHVQAVYDLLDNQSGRKVSLPYHMEAVVSYELLYIRKNLQGSIAEKEFETTIDLKKMIENLQQEIQIELPSGQYISAQLYSRSWCSSYEWDKMLEEAQNSKNSYTKFFECDTIKDTLRIRNVTQDDYFVMNDAGSTKKVSRYFIDRKIPVQQRKEIMVLADGHKVLWIIGERRCEEYKVTKDSTMIIKMTYKGEEYGASD